LQLASGGQQEKEREARGGDARFGRALKCTTLGGQQASKGARQRQGETTKGRQTNETGRQSEWANR